MSYHHRTQKPPCSAEPPGLQTSLPERTFPVPEMAAPTSAARSLPLQTKLEQANRFGHHFSRVGVLSGAPIQPQLTIGQPGDQYEQEADQVAAQVMSMPEKQEDSVQRSGGEIKEGEEEVQMKPLASTITPWVQRNALMPQEEQEEEEPVQAKGSGGQMDAEGLEQSLSTSKGGGSPLPDETRSFMEPRFGADFSGVRVHTDSTASEMNQSIQAQAFTHGKDIYFNSGQFDPGSASGKSLLAHELTHVIQQTGRAE